MEKFTSIISNHWFRLRTYLQSSLLIIGDNSGFLYEYHMDSHDLKRHPLLENRKHPQKTKLILKP
jgi:hypothetical protein